MELTKRHISMKYNQIIPEKSKILNTFPPKIVTFPDINELIPACLKEMSLNGIPFEGIMVIGYKPSNVK